MNIMHPQNGSIKVHVIAFYRYYDVVTCIHDISSKESYVTYTTFAHKFIRMKPLHNALSMIAFATKIPAIRPKQELH